MLHPKVKYFVLLTAAILCISSCTHKQEISKENIYSDAENWACFPTETPNPVDVFFVAPTVYMGDSSQWNMSLSDAVTKENFLGAINMEKGLYDSCANFYAPYYRQVGLAAYNTKINDTLIYNQSLQNAFDNAYQDIENAFDYYLSISDKPFVLAGFSQGSEILIKLLKNRFHNKTLQDKHIATYAIGWRVTKADLEQYPHLKMAQGALDLGKIITFNSEAEFVNSSIFVPKTMKSYSINPLNWKADTTYANKLSNMGACFTNYEGEILTEQEHLTGAYLCPKRGTLKVTDINPDDFFIDLEITPKGVYHLFDYQFFYRNIQDNVQKRMNKYLDIH
jgi:hypothetical protein